MIITSLFSPHCASFWSTQLCAKMPKLVPIDCPTRCPYSLQTKSAHTQLQCWVCGWLLECVWETNFTRRLVGTPTWEIPLSLQRQRALFLSPKYHCSKQCLAECCLQKESDSDNRFSDVSCTSLFGSRAWEQTLLPDAVPVCSWMDIKVLATRQAWLLTWPSNLATLSLL